MVVLEIKDKQLNTKYSREELSYLFAKFVDFLKKENEVVLHEISYDELSIKSKKIYNSLKSKEVEEMDLVNI